MCQSDVKKMLKPRKYHSNLPAKVTLIFDKTSKYFHFLLFSCPIFRIFFLSYTLCLHFLAPQLPLEKPTSKAYSAIKPPPRRSLTEFRL